MLAPSLTTPGIAMKHTRLIASAFVVSSLCLGVTGVQAESKPSAQYQKCMDSVDLGAMKNSQWAACAAQELKRQDVTLNAMAQMLRLHKGNVSAAAKALGVSRNTIYRKKNLLPPDLLD